MKDLVLDLIDSYEHNVMAVETMITSAYETMTDSGDDLSQAYETGQKLKADLRETLVHNHSLRRADFDTFTAKVFDDIEAKKTEIERERKLVRERLKTYLGQQREMVASLKRRLTEVSPEGTSQATLETILADMKASQRQDGEHTFTLLRDFQYHLKTFVQELDELNNKLQRTLERGELVRLEDLRQLRAALASERRKAERELRKEDVQRLLTHFNRERHQGVH